MRAFTAGDPMLRRLLHLLWWPLRRFPEFFVGLAVGAALWAF